MAQLVVEEAARARTPPASPPGTAFTAPLIMSPRAGQAGQRPGAEAMPASHP
jgi:hypothetical protein